MKDVPKPIFARSVAAARQLLGWRQRDLAAAAGLSVGAIQNIEMGKPGVRLSSCERVLKALDDAGAVLFSAHADFGNGVALRLGTRKAVVLNDRPTV